MDYPNFNKHPFHLPSDVVTLCQQQGAKECIEIVFSTAIEPKEINKFQDLMQRLKVGVTFHHQIYRDLEAQSFPTLISYSDPDNPTQFKLQFTSTIELRQGPYLRAYIGLSDNFLEISPAQIAARLLSMINLMFGTSGAYAVCEIGSWKIKDSAAECTREIQGYYTLPGSREWSKEFRDFLKSRKVSLIEDFEIRPDAAEILLIADSQSHLQVLALDERTIRNRQFLLLWTALEKQIGDGKDRKQFFLNFVGSSSLNEKVFNYWTNIRNGIVHKEGKDSPSGKDVEHLRILLQLAFIKKRDLAILFAREIEVYFATTDGSAARSDTEQHSS